MQPLFVYCSLDPEADDREYLMQYCTVVVAVFYAAVSEKYLHCSKSLMVISSPIPKSDIEFETEPSLALEFILRVFIVKCFVVLRVKLSGVTYVLKENRQLQFSFHALRTMDEVDKVQPLIDATVPE